MSAGKFNATAYWATRAKKKFVVTLIGGKDYDRMKTEERIIAAECLEDACAKAEEITYLPNPRVSGVRLATPDDLGCVAA